MTRQSQRGRTHVTMEKGTLSLETIIKDNTELISQRIRKSPIKTSKEH